MALGDLYVTSVQLKSRLGISDTADDTRIANACSSASREIERWCNRQFNVAGSATARSYYADSTRYAIVDDISTTVGLIIAETLDLDGSVTTLTTGEYRLEPLAGAREGVEGWPFWKIKNLRAGVDFPTEDLGVLTVTAKWGWTAVPSPISEAALVLAEEGYKLKEAPFGVANWGEFGPIRVSDNRRVTNLLMKYRRGGMKVA